MQFKASRRILLKALSSKKTRGIIDFAIITLIGIAVFRNFLFSSFWPAGGDILGWISREYLFGQGLQWTYTWRHQSFGFPENIYIMDFFYMALNSLVNNPVFLIKLVMFLSFIFAGFSAYIFAFKYTRNNVASLSAALVYTLNQWVASQLTEAHVAILISYAVFPIIFLIFDHALKSGKNKDSLLFSIGLAFLLTGFHPECVVIYGATLLIFLIVYVFYPLNTERLKTRFKKVFKVLLISLPTAFFLSAFFTIPFMLNVNAPYFSREYGYFIEDCYSISYKNVTDAFTLRAIENWGYMNLIEDVYYGLALKNFPIYALLCLIFILAIIGTLVFRPDKYTVFFTIATVVSILMAMGPYSIFGDIFIWAWFNVPHFSVFRAAGRWIMIAALAYSYFISNMVALIIKYLTKKETLSLSFSQMRNKGKLDEKNKVENRANSELIGFILKKTIKFARITGFFILLAVFVSGFISCAFLFGQGLQVFNLPRSYTVPYYWLSNKSENFKIVTVNNSPSEWYGFDGAETDFAFSGMLTDVGWWHDIGHDSSFIHGKPVLQNGGWDFSSRWFVDFLRYKVARQTLTNNLFKILGLFSYKYVVIPCYASENIRSFFLNQKGGELIYNYSNSLILGNEFYTPRIFAAENYSIIVGGVESLLSLTKIENFNLAENTLIFADKNTENISELLRKADYLIFVNCDFMDLVMLTMKDSIIDASDYGFESLDYASYWVKWPSWRTVGSFVYWGDTLTTNGVNTVKIPFEIKEDGNYIILMRLGFAPNRGELTITLDDLFQTRLRPQTKFWSEPRWINLTCLNLKKGRHTITVRNDGKGFNDIDSIAIIETSRFKEQWMKVLEEIKNIETPVLYMLEAEATFLENPNSVWNFEHHPYNDYLVYPEAENNAILSLTSEKTDFYVPKEGMYQLFVRVLKAPQYGTLHVTVDGEMAFNASCFAEASTFDWVNLGSVYLSQGSHKISIGSTGNTRLDVLTLVSTSESHFASINDIFRVKEENSIVNFEMVNPCLFRVHVKVDKPFILVFSDAFNPNWKVFLEDGTEISPVNIYHIVNGFIINRTGEFDLTVRFVGQDYVDLGFKVSSTTFVAVVVLLMVPEKVYGKVKDRLRNVREKVTRRRF